MTGVVDRARDAEVHDLDVAGAREHHVGRLDIAVDDAVAVGVVQGTERAGRNLQRALWQQATPAREELPQGHPVDVLHDDVGHDRGLGAVDEDVLARVVGGDDVGVVEGGGRLGLASEARLEGRIAREVGPQDLDRHTAAQARVAGLPYLSHAAAADDGHEFVAVAEGPAHAGVLRHACLPDCLCADVPVSQSVPPDA